MIRVLRLVWDLLRGKCDEPSAQMIEQLAHEQDEIEPVIHELEQAAEFRKWQREHGRR